MCSACMYEWQTDREWQSSAAAAPWVLEPWKGGKTAQIHPAKAIYARITFPQRMRRERGGACAYLISRAEAAGGVLWKVGGG